MYTICYNINRWTCQCMTILSGKLITSVRLITQSMFFFRIVFIVKKVNNVITTTTRSVVLFQQQTNETSLLFFSRVCVQQRADRHKSVWLIRKHDYNKYELQIQQENPADLNGCDLRMIRLIIRSLTQLTACELHMIYEGLVVNYSKESSQIFRS